MVMMVIMVTMVMMVMMFIMVIMVMMFMMVMVILNTNLKVQSPPVIETMAPVSGVQPCYMVVFYNELHTRVLYMSAT